MTAIVFAPDKSLIPFLNGTDFSSVIDTFIYMEDDVFSWETTTGQTIELHGAFTYDPTTGDLDAANSAVSKVVIIDVTENPITFSLPTTGPSVLASSLLANEGQFWRTLLRGDSELDLYGDTPAPISDELRFKFGFAADEGAATVALSGHDKMNMFGSGVYAGDTIFGITNTGGNDDLSISRDDANDDIVVVGDALFGVSIIDINTFTGGNDIITDYSSAAGSTILVGDVGESYRKVNVNGGDDDIAGGNFGATIVGDLWSFTTVSTMTLDGGDDTITGGALADILVGDVYDADADTGIGWENGTGGGANIILGGDDEISGGGGDDEIYGEFAFANLSSVSGGDDILKGGNGNDSIYGQTGADTLYGQADNDLLSGGQGQDTISGGAGDDTLIGGKGNDTLSGGNGNDALSGGDGGDTLTGGQNADTLVGGKGTDTLNGGNGKDTLSGGNGNDLINGGKGNDLLSGGKGGDTFIFAGTIGKDVITDFDTSSTSEFIDLSDINEITGWNDLHNNHLSQNGSDTVIGNLNGQTITLINITPDDLSQGDFIFS